MQVMIRGQAKHFRTVDFDPSSREVRLIEQRLLPHEFRVVATRDYPRHRPRDPRHGGARRRGHRRHRRLRPGPGRARLPRTRPRRASKPT